MDALRRGRELYARRAWADAYGSLSRADEGEPLGAADLELLATAAYMIGREGDYLEALERAHHAWLELEQTARAARCAMWVGTTLALRGEVGPATGWLGRAQRLLEHEEGESVERGYLMLPLVFQHEAKGDFAAGASVAAEAAAAGERFGDQDLVALAVHAQGQMEIRRGRIAEGLALLDEAMVAVTTRELSPIVTGLVYCGVILACQEAHELRRAREWTAALAGWCEEQPDLVAFTGRCLIHRAEILQLHGAWVDALGEAQRAAERPGLTDAGAGQAFYRQGELRRLRGEFDAAEDAYREANRRGWEPQPGLALLRLGQGRTGAAVASIQRMLAETTAPLRRASLLPACVEIMLAAGDADGAREACDELERIADECGSAMLSARAAQVRGALALSEGDAAAALVSLREASQTWQALEAPYEVARARVRIAAACRLLGDEDTAALELEAARGVFERLGAAPDLSRLDSLEADASARRPHGLTQRELEVLCLVATGKTNREIAEQLVISEHTVARHLQNIFAKLGLSSRTAASAFAYEHDLV